MALLEQGRVENSRGPFQPQPLCETLIYVKRFEYSKNMITGDAQILSCRIATKTSSYLIVLSNNNGVVRGKKESPHYSLFNCPLHLCCFSNKILHSFFFLNIFQQVKQLFSKCYNILQTNVSLLEGKLFCQMVSKTMKKLYP